ncbi:hypothetical protein ABUE31_04070 [Mesorhizobium sp. ZMM04-5]|uniref:Uncharacterized protein n=1 Tax=Mesorhizobium marinum TaxID=3228790 RepID=A0ABV3QVR7_9HYPH
MHSAPTPATSQVDTLPAPASYEQATQAPVGLMPPALQPGCHTVDNVTLCDAPVDPTADETLHTN